MMQSKEDQSYRFKQQLKNFLIPSRSALFMFFIIGIFILIILNFNTIKNIVFGYSIGSVQDIVLYSDRLSVVWSWLGNVIVWIFWGILGLIIYTTIWFVQNVILITEEENEQSHYTDQGLPNKKSYWRTTISSNILVISLAFIWIVYVTFCIWIYLGFLSNLLTNGLYNFPELIAVVYLILSIFLSVCLIYIFQLISKLVVYSWRVIKPE